MPPKEKNSVKGYAGSRAQKLLFLDVKDGTIPPDMDFEEAFFMREEFAQYDGARKFEDRLEAARKREAQKRNRSEEEMQALLEDMETVGPRPEMNRWGEPQWEGSDAQTLLKKDVLEDQKHKQMNPFDLWLSRPEYQQYDKDRFRDRIYQVQKTDKFTKHMHAKYHAKTHPK